MLPDADSRKGVYDLLDLIDKKITTNSNINKKLHQLAKTVFDYWFIQFEFPNKEGKPYISNGGLCEYNKELKRDIPTGWVSSNIFKVANLIGGGTPSKKVEEYWEGEIPFFTPTDSDNHIYKLTTTDLITDLGLKNSSTKLFDVNTIFITARGSVGRLMLNAVPMAMNQSCYALQSKISTHFPYLYFLTSELIHHLKVKATGSVFNSIVSDDIDLTKLSLPANDEIIDAYCSKVLPYFKKIEDNVKENQKLENMRNWLLPLLMNGQVTVK
jgi:type I restriction enzyme S subunit